MMFPVRERPNSVVWNRFHAGKQSDVLHVGVTSHEQPAGHSIE